MYEEELQQSHDEERLLLGFVKINGLKEESWNGGGGTSNENSKIL